MNLDNKSTLFFIHANGFLPDAYESMFSNFDRQMTLKYYYLQEVLKNKKNLPLKNWVPFHDGFIQKLKHENKKVVGIGHSIGGNIILRAALSHPELFSQIVLLDPTLFVPKIMFFWKLFYYTRLQNRFHPFMMGALNRKMEYKNYDRLFSSYRSKGIFSKIDDENLNIYIKSITQKIDNRYKIIYPKDFEYMIYKTGLIADKYIWDNLEKLDIPTLIIRAKHSNAFLKNSADLVINKNKKIKIVTLDEVTHLFPLEKPSLTAGIVIKALTI